MSEDHSEHGRGSPELGPDDPDCPCRKTELEGACAEAGCGFCISSRDSAFEEMVKDAEDADLYTPQNLPTMEEILANTSEAVKTYWLTVFLLLNRHEKFHQLIEENFEISKVLDDEKQTIDINVELKPPKPKLITGAQMMKMHSVLIKAGLRDKASKVLNELLNVIKVGVEDVPSIIPAGEADMTKAIQEKTYQDELKSKL